MSNKSENHSDSIVDPLTSDPERNETEEDEKDKNHLLNFEFHIEWLRIFGITSIVLMIIICKLITDFVIFPNGVNKDGMRIEETTIYKIFGFNHSCNVLDFNPAKLVASMMLPFFTLPMIVYLVFSHCLVYKVCRYDGVHRSLLHFSRVMTVFCIYVFAILHLWFVNGPEMEPYGFIGHYLPYIAAQIALGLLESKYHRGIVKLF